MHAYNKEPCPSSKDSRLALPWQLLAPRSASSMFRSAHPHILGTGAPTSLVQRAFRAPGIAPAWPYNTTMMSRSGQRQRAGCSKSPQRKPGQNTTQQL
jgi:hypothetical protein